jgi:hypothetical protein
MFSIEVRYLFNFYEVQKISDESWMFPHGWNVSAQVWW